MTTSTEPEPAKPDESKGGERKGASGSAFAEPEGTKPAEAPNPLREMIQPFIDLVHAPRALWGINVTYLIEGFVYFGMLGYLAMYFNEYVGLSDVAAGMMVGTLTWGITLSMFFFGGLADKWGVRAALMGALLLMLVGRVLLAGGPFALRGATGAWSSIHLVALAGILFVVLGYGMYQPAAYSGVRQFTTPKTAPMGYAMLYAVMNLGGWLPTFFPAIRKSVGISGAYVVYLSFTVVGLILLALLLTPRVQREAIAKAEAQKKAIETAEGKGEEGKQPNAPAEVKLALGLKYRFLSWGQILLTMIAVILPLGGVVVLGGAIYRFTDASAEALALAPIAYPRLAALAVFCATLVMAVGLLALGDFIQVLKDIEYHLGVTRAREAAAREGYREPAALEPKLVEQAPANPRELVWQWARNHPLANPKFAFFIFALIPVQTLFAHNWLTLPMYVERAYKGTWLGSHFEAATNFNSLMIFILVPIVAAVTQKAKVYNMMIYGTAVMAAPTFLLAIGPSFWTLLAFLVLMTLGEAMWQPRFLQYAAEIAPPGRTGAYMGVAQFPWFLTKVIVSFYSGWFLSRYCPIDKPAHTEKMWLIYGLIAMMTTVLLVLAKGWLGKDFKTKAA